jgi:predicted ATP-grasp superfamily ATP-dependent carboligase
VRELIARRLLWGNGLAQLAWSRDPFRVRRVLRVGDVKCPRLRHVRPLFLPRKWLVKPWAGTGGTGISVYPWKGSRGTGCRKRYYYQEYVPGAARAAVYVGTERGANLLGLTRQLVGERWLHVRRFQYCGSIGPLEVEPVLQAKLTRIGDAFARGWIFAAGSGLRGLFGVDCIVRDGIPWPVEVNPRYTASVEVLEYGAGVPAMALHRAVFDPGAPSPSARSAAAGVVGKAILFARAPLVFPDDGPWSATLRSPGPIEEMPDFADIPPAGERIQSRRPILAFFTRAANEAACLEQLKAIAADLDRWLFER